METIMRYLLYLTVLLCGCGGGGGESPNAYRVGRWSGTWTNPLLDKRGTVQAEWNEDGSMTGRWTDTATGEVRWIVAGSLSQDTPSFQSLANCQRIDPSGFYASSHPGGHRYFYTLNCGNDVYQFVMYKD